MRPFGRKHIGPHLFNQHLWDKFLELKFTCVLWSFVPQERADPDNWMYSALAACEKQPWTVLGMHDITTGAMKNLSEFLDLILTKEATFSQAFPEELTPVRSGREIGPHDHLMPPQNLNATAVPFTYDRATAN